MGNQVDLFKQCAVPAVVPNVISTTSRGEEGVNYFPNEIELMAGQFDGKAYGSNVVNLQGDQSVDYPIVHQLGSETVVNGTFDADTDWDKQDGWTISAGEAHCDGTQTANTELIPHTPPLIVGSVCKVTFTVTAISAGSIRLSYGGGMLGDWITEAGTYTDIFTPLGIALNVRADADFLGAIDNISVKEVTVDNSYATYLDYGTLKHKSISSTGDVGEELVTNSDFSDGLNGWAPSRAAILTDGTGFIHITAGNTGYGGAYNAIDLPSNRKFRLKINKQSQSTEGSFYVLVATTAEGGGTRLFEENMQHLVLGDHEFYFSSGDDIGKFINISNGYTGSEYPNAYIESNLVSAKEVLPVSTTYNLTVPHQNYFTHSTALTANEVAQLDARPNLIFEVWFNGLVLADGFAKANMVNFLPGNEGLR